MIGSCGSSTSSKICSGNSPKKQSRRFVRRLCRRFVRRLCFVRARVITLAVFRQAIGCRSVFKREQRASCFSLNYALFFVLLHGLSSEAVLKRVRFCVYWENALRHSRGKGFDPPHLHQREVLAEMRVLFLFVVCKKGEGDRRRSGTEQQSGGLSGPRMTEARRSRRESIPLIFINESSTSVIAGAI